MNEQVNAAPVMGTAVEIRAGASPAPFLILCDHATNLLPPGFGGLGLEPAQLERHIAYDIGARGVAIGLAERLNATCIASRFSRLLIDPNRGADDPTLIMKLSDGAVIPGNVNLSPAEETARRRFLYDAYHEAIASELDRMTGSGMVPVILSIHSFTDAWRGSLRPWHAGMLWDKDPRLALPLLEALRDVTGQCVGDNEPYAGRLKGDCLYRHGTMRGFPHALVEIRQDLIRDVEGQNLWAGHVARALEKVLGGPSHAQELARVAFFGSHADLSGNIASQERGGK